MNIKYKNYVAPDYVISESPVTFFHSTDVFSDEWEKTIVLSKDPGNYYDDEESSLSTSNLCEELINVKDQNDALTFTKKYGALVNTRLFRSNFSEMHSSSTVSDMVNSECGPSYEAFDLMLYNHFMFYQHDLYYLQLIHSKLANLSQNASSAQFFLDLLNDTAVLLTNPYLNETKYIEYTQPDVPDIVNDTFPYAKFRFYIDDVINPLYEDIPVFNFGTRTTYKLDNSDFEDIFFDLANRDVKIFPKTFPCVLFLDAIGSTVQNQDYWLDQKECIIQYAELLFNDILSFHLREITPYSKISVDSAELCWNFPSLAHAIFFDFYNQITGNSTYKICANENCKKIFLCNRNKYKIYCSKRCAHNTTNRKSIRKKREHLKSMADD